jgi:cell division septation protein DedD
MPNRTERKDEKGLSARYLILVFLMGVAACAVFFSLGFLVGYNERPSKTAGPVEEVIPAGEVPPLVNPPRESPVTGVSSGSATSSGELPTEHVAASEGPPKAAAERAAVTQLAPPAAKPATSAPASKAPERSGRSGRTAQPGTGFTVQVAASRDKQDAEKLVKELRSRGFDVFVVTPQFSDAKDNLYRVQVGPYATREEAVRVRDRIAKEGFKPFIRR